MPSRFSKPQNEPSPFDSSSFDQLDPFAGPSDPFDPFSGGADSFDQGFGSPSAFTDNPSGHGGGRSGGPGKGRNPLFIVLAVLAVLLVAVVILLAVASPGTPRETFAPKLDPGEISASITALQDGQYHVQLTHELQGLDPAQIYVAGFLMAPEGQDMVAISEPDYVMRTDHHTVTAEIVITRPGSYQIAFYSYPLSNPTPSITKAQMLEIGAGTSQTPLPDETVIIVVTPSPSPTPVPTPAPTPSPTPQRTEATLQLQPASDLFDLYDVNTRYYYHLLTDVQKQAFSQMYDGVAAGKSVISLTPCMETDYIRAIRALQYDCPELFHWDHEDGSMYVTNSKKQVIELHPNRYVYDVNTYRTKLNQVLSEIRTLSSLPGFYGSDFSKQQTIYDYLIRKGTYNKELPYCAYADSIYLYGYAKCTGYARALNLALRYYGIPCTEAIGDTYDNGVLAPVSHMWSVACIDGDWYHCDATWDDIDKPFIQHAYLNLTARLMFAARVEDEVHDILPLPACTSTDANAMMKDGTYVRAGSDVKSILIRKMADSILSGGGYIQFSFESSSDCNTVLMLLQKQSVINEIYAEAHNTMFHSTYYKCADVNYIGVNIYFE